MQLFITETEHVVVESKKKLLIFEPTDGSFTIDAQYDSYSTTAQKVVSEFYIAGIIGQVNFVFAKYLLVISKKELAACSFQKSKSVWRVLKVVAVPIWKQHLPLSLDQEDLQKESLDAISQYLSSGFMYIHHESLDEAFVWNRQLLAPLAGCGDFAVPLFCGHSSSHILHLNTSVSCMIHSFYYARDACMTLISLSDDARSITYSFSRGNTVFIEGSSVVEYSKFQSKSLASLYTSQHEQKSFYHIRGDVCKMDVTLVICKIIPTMLNALQISGWDTRSRYYIKQMCSDDNIAHSLIAYASLDPISQFYSMSILKRYRESIHQLLVLNEPIQISSIHHKYKWVSFLLLARQLTAPKWIITWSDYFMAIFWLIISLVLYLVDPNLLPL